MRTQVTREDQLMAAISHASVLLPLLGAILPLGIWLSQKERSPLLRFQALQALIYHGLGLLAYFGLTACQFVGSFAAFPMMVVPVALLEDTSDQTAAVFGILLMIVMGLVALGSMLLNLLVCILGPVYLLIGVWAAWQVLNEKDYHYPLLGGWLAKRIET